MAGARAVVLVAHLGLTTKALIGARTAKNLDATVAEIRAVHDAPKEVREEVLVICHLGPVSGPDGKCELRRYVTQRPRALCPQGPSTILRDITVCVSATMIGPYPLLEGGPILFEELFKRVDVVQRHLAAPLARSRLGYLSHCAERGLQPSTLQLIARYQVEAARLLPLKEAREVSRAQINAAVAQWVAENPARRSRAGGREFVRLAVDWLRFADLLQRPARPEIPHAGDLANFADYMRREHGRTTIRVHANALRAFFRHGARRGWSRPGLAAVIPLPRVYGGESLPAGPSQEDVQRFVASAEGDRPASLHDRAILLLLSAYGLCSGEVRLLQLDDIDWEAETLRVRRPKPDRNDLYPLSRTVGDAILREVADFDLEGLA